MTGTPSSPLDAETPINQLVQALHRRGLAAHIFERDGVQYVHVSPLLSPAAGMHIRATTTDGGVCAFFSEWGSLLGNDLLQVIWRVTWLFGKGRPRP